MDKTQNINITEEDEGKRLDNFLSDYFVQKSRTQIQNLIKEGGVSINSIKKKPSYSLKEGDIISLEFKEEELLKIEAENIPLDVRYEDEMMLIINKPKDMLTHPTTKEKTGTLVNALLNKYSYEGLSDVNGSFRPGILHRLDRNTSGLLMVAKTNEAHEFLSNQIRNKTAIRKYLAVIQGTLKQDEGTIESNIARHPTKPEKMAVLGDGKPSITNYKVLERFKQHTFIELQLQTGRTHQIRVHMSDMGHPIVNDSLYGAAKIKVKTTEQVLQSYDLTFTTPSNNSIINLQLDYDNDLQKVLNYLRSKK